MEAFKENPNLDILTKSVIKTASGRYIPISKIEFFYTAYDAVDMDDLPCIPVNGVWRASKNIYAHINGEDLIIASTYSNKNDDEIMQAFFDFLREKAATLNENKTIILDCTKDFIN